MVDNDDAEALEFFARIEDAIINNLEVGNDDVICTSTTSNSISNSSISLSSSNTSSNNHFEEDSSSDIRMDIGDTDTYTRTGTSISEKMRTRTRTLTVGKEDSIGNSKDYTHTHTHKEEDGTGTLGDMDLPVAVTDSGRTIINGNTQQSSEHETVTLETIDMAGTSGIDDTTPAVTLTNAESTITENDNDTNSTKEYMYSSKEAIREPSNDGDMNTSDDDDDGDGDGDGDGDDDTSTRLSEPTSAMKFHPLQPLPGKSLSPGRNQSDPDTDTNMGDVQDHDQYHDHDHAASPDEAGAAHASKEGGSFMNNIQDPVAASKVFKVKETLSEDENEHEHEHENSPSTQQMLSHTPPTSMSTSYETTHFGKRPRSGVSRVLLLLNTELRIETLLAILVPDNIILSHIIYI